MSFKREVPYGIPTQPPRSSVSQVRVAPTGYSDTPALLAEPGSITSGQNVWLWNGLRCRPRLQQLGTTNPLNDVPTGGQLYNSVDGAFQPVVESKRTVSTLIGDTWQPLTYVSGMSNNPPSGGQNDFWFGAITYLPRVDQNILVLVNGVDPAFAAMPSRTTTYSTLTQGLIAHDVAAFDNRIFYWNIRYSSSASQLVQRLAWTTRGNPEESSTTNIGPGYVDVFDMVGYGTRVIPRLDGLLIATDQQVWTAQPLGDAFGTYNPQPFLRSVGMPHSRAVLNTPDGLFWLGQDLMVYHMPLAGYDVQPIGAKIQRTLHQEIGDPFAAFLGYHADARQLTLYYEESSDSFTRRGWTLNTLTGQWAPQRYSHGLTVGFSTPIVVTSVSSGSSGSGAPVWDALVGSFAANAQTYNELLSGSPGVGGSSSAANFVEVAVASAGTVYAHIHPEAQATDDGVAVHHEATLATPMATVPERNKWVERARWDFRADSASSVSVAISGNFGQTYPQELQLSVSATSVSSQIPTTWSVAGPNPTVRVRSTGGTWELVGLAVQARFLGEEL